MTTLRAITGSRMLNRVLPWLGALVLAAGIATFVVVYFGSDDEPTTTRVPANELVPNRPAEPATRRSVPLPEQARRVAAEFISTAVARKNLARAYALTHPSLRQGMTLKEWKTGNIPVQPYPVQSADFKLDYSYPNEAQMQVSLKPQPGAGMQRGFFVLGLKKYRRHWTVDYWGPRGTIPVPTHD